MHFVPKVPWWYHNSATMFRPVRQCIGQMMSQLCNFRAGSILLAFMVPNSYLLPTLFNYFITTSTMTIASLRQGTWLKRPDPRSHIESTLYWVPDWQVELYCTGLLPEFHNYVPVQLSPSYTINFIIAQKLNEAQAFNYKIVNTSIF